ncbi:hypothetical protein D7Y13_03090 [Corallococcus praedator]|uniref:Uncharacterized protein n=1 Tax=Corallococcus praedator TaxID=2316724 RepID=A0ABX9QQ38_9BACT|nr:hypothetical protein D7X74_03295 [Corallococcus sp. CA047B]RKH33367.1 hypothetical protein D7X75_12500 [Corallococcus sp. CA031C]RKI16245.1 hypothetical protein D7Y13_03090 [Corallococcus praedator]
MLRCPSDTTPTMGTRPSARRTSSRSGTRFCSLPDSSGRASSTWPERHSRTTQSTSCPTSGASPSMASTARPCCLSAACSRPESSSWRLTNSS